MQTQKIDSASLDSQFLPKSNYRTPDLLSLLCIPEVGRTSAEADKRSADSEADKSLAEADKRLAALAFRQLELFEESGFEKCLLVESDTS